MNTDYHHGSEIMKEHLIKNARYMIRISQQDLISAWKKRWVDHTVCRWLIEALLANKSLQLHVVVSPLDAAAGAAGDQYSFGSGAERTFELLKYYITHDLDTDELLSDENGDRADALKRVLIAPFFSLIGYQNSELRREKPINGRISIWRHIPPRLSSSLWQKSRHYEV
ncbi:MAG: hypothetical protein RAM36_02360, partial [Arsenophonus sp.]|nr:hypothetical protein [Arsenophonus sp.]